MSKRWRLRATMSDRSELDELEARLRQVQHDVDAASAEVRSARAEPGAMQRLSEAIRKRTVAQRKLAAARNLEWADELAWPHRWDPGAPCPHVVSSGDQTHLVYLVHEPDPAWDGSYATPIHTNDASIYRLATVTFERCYWHRFGGPNDEVFDGHPLAERGFDGYHAFLIRNSRWIEEARTINSVHPMYRPATWTALNHYLFGFHDQLFECLARGYRIDVRRETFATALERCARMARAR